MVKGRGIRILERDYYGLQGEKEGLWILERDDYNG